jgi:hypothetical protein
MTISIRPSQSGLETAVPTYKHSRSPSFHAHSTINIVVMDLYLLTRGRRLLAGSPSAPLALWVTHVVMCMNMQIGQPLQPLIVGPVRTGDLVQQAQPIPQLVSVRQCQLSPSTSANLIQENR